MSSDFLEDVDNDSNGMSVSLSMKASCDAFLWISGGKEEEEDSSWKSVYYHLPPNETGWKNAERIVEALKSWVEYSKRIS